MSPSRRWVWTVFGVGVTLLVLALGALSYQVVRLERAQSVALAARAQDEATRRSLLRMDSLLAPMIASEARRPYFDYRGVRAAGRPYGRAMEPPATGEALEASSLLLEAAGAVAPEGLPPELVKVRFQIDPDGRVSSPEAPEPAMLAALLAQQPTVPLDLERIETARALLARLKTILGPGGDQLPVAADGLDGAELYPAGKQSEAAADYQFRQRVARYAQNSEPRDAQGGRSVGKPAGTLTGPIASSMPEGVEGAASLMDSAKDETGDADYGVAYGERAAGAAPAPRTSFARPSAPSAYDDGSAGVQPYGVAQATPEPRIETGPLEPAWTDTDPPELLLTRRVDVGGEVYTQGVWVSWDGLKRTLAESVSDVALDGTLEPVRSVDTAPGAVETRLATIPARFVVGPIEAGSPGYGVLTPARWGLMVMWGGLVGAALATWFALRATLRLADRRGKFVSAVTHELRTPLTSFRLYSQMLASGMVTDESARADYLKTLDRESARLGETVENVLAYARLDRSSKRARRPDPITPQALLARVVPTLARRAERDGMDLVVGLELDKAGGRVVYADPASVERVLLNLVENACKYAGPIESPAEGAPDAETRIHLDAQVSGDRLEVVVSDYGPGIAAEDRARVFGEFVRGKAGERADRGGLGLGLALARGLARDAGGDLELVRGRGTGAAFRLWLPMQAAGGGGSPSGRVAS